MPFRYVNTRDLLCIKRDLLYVKRDLLYIKRDLLTLAHLPSSLTRLSCPLVSPRQGRGERERERARERKRVLAGRARGWWKFSKISFLLNLLRKLSIVLTFRNLHQIAMCEREAARSFQLLEPSSTVTVTGGGAGGGGASIHSDEVEEEEAASTYGAEWVRENSRRAADLFEKEGLLWVKYVFCAYLCTYDICMYMVYVCE
jgi:hypothetical protein